MKKYIVLILMFLVALTFSQDVYRINDSTFVYPCIGDSTTMLNFVGLPLETDFVKASDFDPVGTNINAVSRYDAQEQGWETAGYHSALGWGTDFSVETGGAYMINALNNFDFIVIGDSVEVFYDLITHENDTDLNFIVHPLNKGSFKTISELGNDVGNVNDASEWIVTSQSWNTGVNYGEIWWPEFSTEIGKPMILNMTQSVSWPVNKEKLNMDHNSNNLSDNSKGTGGPRVVYFHFQDQYANEIDFDIFGKQINFQAWIESRPSEIITKDTFGCGLTTINGLLVIYVNLSSFPTIWGQGNTLVLRPDGHPAPDAYVILDASGSPIYSGFEDQIPGTGIPYYVYLLYSPNPVTTIEGDSLTLSWSYNYLVDRYEIYESDEPYGTFTYLTYTTDTSWQTPITESKKFYYVVSENSYKSNHEETIFVKEEE